MKVVLFLFMLMNSAFAWEIVTQEDKAYLLDSDKKIKEEVFADKTRKEVSTKDLNSDLKLIIYLESIGGTTEATKTYNCAVYSNSQQKLLFKNNLCRTVSLKKTGKEEITSATFSVATKKLIYVFEELTESYPLSK
jgi:hypothetical protein